VICEKEVETREDFDYTICAECFGKTQAPDFGENADGEPAPFFVEVEDPGCRNCGTGKTWAVVGPDGCTTGMSYGDEDDAQEQADDLNNAFVQGKSSKE
jgi:hypothetical protein